MRYIDLAAAEALVRERGVLGEGYSATERENDVCDLLEEVPWIELPYTIGSLQKLSDRQLRAIAKVLEWEEE